MDHFDIKLDNPVTILHQEEAKTFFSQKDSEKNLYEFVMASTLMQPIQAEYRDSKTQLELANIQLQDKRRHLEEAKQELDELIKNEKSFERFQFRDRSMNYNEMIKWGWANDLKKKYETSRSLLEETQLKLRISQTNLNGWKGSIESLLEKKEEYLFKTNDVKDRAKAKEDELEVLKRDLMSVIEQKNQVDLKFKEINVKQGKHYTLWIHNTLRKFFHGGGGSK